MPDTVTAPAAPAVPAVPPAAGATPPVSEAAKPAAPVVLPAEVSAALAKETIRINAERRKVKDEAAQHAAASAKAKAEFEAERASFAKEREELLGYKTKWAGAKRNPDAVAKELWGEDYYDQLTQAKLAGQTFSPEMVARLAEDTAKATEERLLGEFRKRDEAAEQAKRDQIAALNAENEALIARFHEESAEAIRGASEKYPLTNLWEGAEDVPKAVQRAYEKEGKSLTLDAAAESSEALLLQRIEKAALVPKVAARLRELLSIPATPSAAAPPPFTRATLDSRMSAATTPGAKTALPPWKNENERLQRAIAAAEAAKAAQGT